MPIFRRTETGHFETFEKTAFPDLEQVLEDWIESSPQLVSGELPIAIIGRQSRSPFAKKLDLLGMDETGAMVIVELKRGETPRDVVAQTLEYAAWVESLSIEELDEICREYSSRHGLDSRTLEDVYGAAFGDSDGALELDDEDADDEDVASRVTFNARQRMVIVAERFSGEVEQAIRYLRTRLGVDMTAIRFSVHQAADEVLIETETVVGREPASAPSRRASRSGESEPHEVTEARVEGDFLKETVPAVEEWFVSLGVPNCDVRHGRRSLHGLYYKGKRILHYYFAKRWMYCWLLELSSTEIAELRRVLSVGNSVGERGRGARFHVYTEDDLDVVKRLVRSRLS